MTVVKQFSIFMVNKPGILARVLGEFAKSKVNIVAMTSVSNREMEQRVRVQGVIYYMIKPFEFDELRSIINHLARRKVKLCSQQKQQ